MIRVLMSKAAAGLLRALIARAGASREEILISDVQSVDWQSLTIVGERHELGLRIIGPHAGRRAHALCDGLAEAELEITGQIVADIAVVHGPSHCSDGSVALTIEALTVCADD
jgi:hypothetical protein